MPYKKKGSPYYYIRLKPPGYPHRIGPLSTREKSKAVVKQVEALIRELALAGRHEFLDAIRLGKIRPVDLYAARAAGRLEELLTRATDPLLERACQSFLLSHPSGHKNYRAAMGWLVRVAGKGAHLSWLTSPEHLRRYVAELRGQGMSAGTERRHVSALSLLIRQHYGRQRRDTLIKGLYLRPEAEGVERWLGAEEIERVREVAGDWWVLISLALASGLRRGELLRLLVRDLDLEHGAVTVRKGKSKAARRRVPLEGEALELVRRFVAEELLGPSDTLFDPKITGSRVWHAWDRIRQQAAIPHVRFHDLRHTYGVHCARSGMPMPELQQRLGHASLRVTMRYAIYSPGGRDHYRNALEGMGMSGPESQQTLPLQVPVTQEMA